MLKNLSYYKVRKISSRIFIEGVNPSDWKLFNERMKNVMGLKNATLMIKSDNTIQNMKKSIDVLINDCNYKTFRISTKRHFKGFEKTSQELNMELGEYVLKKNNKAVSLDFPDLNIIIEVLKDKTYLGYNKIVGYSGLPVKSQEKAFSLISSGIDSPVASFEMIKRGVNLNFIHFHSMPAINKQSVENVKKIINVLLNYQLESNLFIVPLLLQRVDDVFDVYSVDNEKFSVWFMFGMDLFSRSLSNL